MQGATTSGLVSSLDVTGTPVYSSIDGKHIGEIDHLVIDRVSGRIVYADVGFGGFLGLAQDHHLLPWGKLRYDPREERFVTDVTRESLERAPPRIGDQPYERSWEERVHQHYNVPHYWI